MGKIGLGLTHDEVFFNGRSKYYTDRNGNKQWLETIVASKAIFNPTKVEASDTEWSKELYCGKCEKQEDEVTSTTQASSVRAARRAAKKVFEIALCTYEFTHFVTLTLSPEQVKDRGDYKAVINQLNTWLDNRVRRKGLIYLLCPERHKDGAIHFHGLVNGEAVKLVDSGTVSCTGHKKPIKTATADRLKIPQEDRHTVYNIADWSFGFTTAIALYGEAAAAAAYTAKYITKDVRQGSCEKVGGRYYLSGGKLRLPHCEYFNAYMPQADEVEDTPTTTEQMFGIADTTFYLSRPKRTNVR